MSICLFVYHTLSVCLFGSHMFSQAIHAFLGMLPLCLVYRWPKKFSSFWANSPENVSRFLEATGSHVQWWFVNPGSDSPEISLVRTISVGTDFRVRTKGRFSNPENSLIRNYWPGTNVSGLTNHHCMLYNSTTLAYSGSLNCDTLTYFGLFLFGMILHYVILVHVCWCVIIWPTFHCWIDWWLLITDMLVVLHSPNLIQLFISFHLYKSFVL